MRRVAFCWEAGGGHGHIFRMLLLATELRRGGVEPVFIVKDIGSGTRRVVENGYRLLQAPLPPRQNGAQNITVNNFADILLGQGFNSADTLSSLLKAWRDTVELIAPELIIADFAPTALLATKTMAIPQVIYGNPFGAPPPRSPFPSLRPWSDLTPERLMRSDATALKNANESLARLGEEPLTSLAAIHSVARNYLCCFKELDPYGKRPDGNYIGHLFDAKHGAPPTWPAGEGKKLFAYLPNHHPLLKPLLEAISRMPIRCLAYIPGAVKDSDIAPNIRVSTTPIAIAPLMAQADGFASGGHGTISASLLAGKPVLLLPAQLEQRLLATTVEAMQCGLHLPPHSSSRLIGERLTTLLQERGATERSRRFAQQYTDFDPKRVIREVAKELLQLIEHPEQP